ncbi:MAG TPA: tRNA preQ1(34) S-adenosylmethionine ribosyltransferase-isomerase QueA [Anaerolineales bacterium]
MHTDDFDYQLPSDRIAQRPAQPRDSSRLLLLDRASGRLEHHTFHQLPDLLRPGDALVLNETRVRPVRLHGRKTDGGGKVELLLLEKQTDVRWQAMVGGSGLRPGRRIALANGLQAEVVDQLEGPRRLIEFTHPVEPVLDELGEMPLPPYIHEPLQHPDDYQTVFAQQPGSAAAPTAGLHFTPELLERLAGAGVSLVRLTLHVGMDTFAPVKTENPAEHPIHTEWCELTPEAAMQLERLRQAGDRIVAVGTTSVRTLETAARSKGSQLGPWSGPTDLFILPGFTFQVVDAMITNFHLPRSSLLMLVSAFAGRQRILDAYQSAIDHGYRFYSFGDAMLIV